MALLATRLYERPSSAITDEKGTPLSYFGFLSSGVNAACTSSLLRLEGEMRRHEEKISQTIETMPIPSLSKDFYHFMLGQRYQQIIQRSINHLPSSAVDHI